MEIFNSIMIMLMIYCLMCFTPLVLDSEARYQMGFVMVGLVALNVLVNILVISIDPVRLSCMRCKLRWARRHAIKRRCGRKCSAFWLCWMQRCCSKDQSVEDISTVADPKESLVKLETISEENSASSLDSGEEVDRKL
mmetsp:Transcript_5495/g.7341  ORF Transcript_5495/g.7341 Transcript_5495/m.7341 type:complete len:138 (-) Transcript_5495:1480-1893(-)